MATKCLIVVDDGINNVVLYKHWDGYPENMIPLLKEFASEYYEEVKKREGFFPHFLFQSEDVASGLIVFDHLKIQEEEKNYKEEWKRPKLNPDIRPTNYKKEEVLGTTSITDLMGENYIYYLKLDEKLKEWTLITTDYLRKVLSVETILKVEEIPEEAEVIVS